MAPNRLDRDFAATRPNEKWAGDITAIWTYEGWLYLAAVLDLFSRRVVGWAMAASADETDAARWRYAWLWFSAVHRLGYCITLIRDVNILAMPIRRCWRKCTSR